MEMMKYPYREVSYRETAWFCTTISSNMTKAGRGEKKKKDTSKIKPIKHVSPVHSWNPREN